MRKLLTLALLLLFSCAARAQNFTTVTATVKDTNGNAYSFGTYTVALVNTSGQQAQFGGNPNFQQTYQGGLDTNGVMSVPLPSVTVMTPNTGLQWKFFVCANPKSIAAIFPPATLPCFNYTSTGTQISGTSFDLTPSFGATPVPVIPSVPGNAPSNTGAVNGFNVKNYGAVGDAKASFAVTLTQVSPTITDTTNSPWVGADAGKNVSCTYGPSNAFVINNATGIAQILTVNSSSSVTLSANMIGGINTATNQYCVWYTKEDSGAFCCGPGSAYAAAHTSVSGNNPQIGGPKFIGQLPGAITCSGGFAVSGPILNQIENASTTRAVSLIGNGCEIYVLPNWSAQGSAGLISNSNAYDFTMQGMDIYGGGLQFDGVKTVNAWPQNQGFIVASNIGHFFIFDNRISGWGGSQVGTDGLLVVKNPSGPSKIEKNHITGSIGSSLGLACTGCAGFPTLDSNYIGNNGSSGNMLFFNAGGRNVFSGPLTIIGHLGDECGAAQGTGLTNACVQLQNSTVIIKGGVLFGPGASISLDGTSEADVDGTNIGAFNSGGNFPAVILANGAKFVMTDTTVRGNGTGVAFSQISGTSTVQDLGGNVIQNCVNTVCSAASIAQTSNAGVNFLFPLTPTATTQLGGSQTVAGNAPTACAVTGNGTSTCALDTGSTNAAWTVTITAAGTTTAVGNVQFTLNGTMGTNSTTCTANYSNLGTGSWAIAAISPIFTTNTTSTVAFNINNAGTNLTATSTYKIGGNCYGK